MVNWAHYTYAIGWQNLNEFMSLPVSCSIPYLKYLAEETKIGDPIEAPPGPYLIQPDNQGKLLWITGSPGVGKSTSAQLLGRKKGKILSGYHFTK